MNALHHDMMPENREVPHDRERLSAAPDAVEVRRNAGLAAIVGVAASAVAIAYLARASQTGGVFDWLLVVVMGAIGALHLHAFVDARTPLLVADGQGVRLRLGSTWRGLPWGALHSVEHEPRRGMLRDGRLVLLPRNTERELEELDAGGRRQVRISEKLYGAPFALPLGLTTRVVGSGGDLTAALEALAAGTTEVVEIRHADGDDDASEGPALAKADERDEDESDWLAAEPAEAEYADLEYREDEGYADDTMEVGRLFHTGRQDSEHDEAAFDEEVVAPAELSEDDAVEGTDAAESDTEASDTEASDTAERQDFWLFDSDRESAVFDRDPQAEVEGSAQDDAAMDEDGEAVDPGDEEDEEPAPAARIGFGAALRGGLGRVRGAFARPPADVHADVPAADPVAPAEPGENDLPERELSPAARYDGQPSEPAAGSPAPSPLRANRAAARAEVRRDVFQGAAALKLSGNADGPSTELPEARELRRHDREDALVEDTEVWGDRVRPIATAKDAVEPLVLTDFEVEPAQDPVVGPELAAARTRIGLTVDQLAERTRIRPHVIESIEVDDFAPCGGDFYARGHLRTLARVLGVDVDGLLRHYDERYAHAPISPRRVFEAELASASSGGLRSTRGGPNWSVLIAVIMAIVLAWSIARLVMTDPPEVRDAPILNGSEGVPEAAPLTDPVRLKVVAAHGDARVVVRDADGEVVFRGMLAEGETKRVKGTGPLRVRASDGGAVEAVVDGKNRGTIGETGEKAVEKYGAAR